MTQLDQATARAIVERIASEFSEAVSSALDGGSIPVYVGSYEAKA